MVRDDWILDRVYAYIFEYWNEYPSIKNEFNELMKKHGSGSRPMALADRIYDEGKDEGLEEGREEGKQKLLKTAVAFLKTGASRETVIKNTGLTREELEKAETLSSS